MPITRKGSAFRLQAEALVYLSALIFKRVCTHVIPGTGLYFLYFYKLI